MRFAAILVAAATLGMSWGCTTSTEDPEPLSCADNEVLDESMGDEGTCVPVHCGTTTFGPNNENADYFVDPSVKGDGQGTRAKPWKRVDLAYRPVQSAQGAVVALAAGTHPGGWEWDSQRNGLILSGRCPELTVIDGHAGENAQTPNILLESSQNTRVELRHLTLSGGYEALLVRSGRVVLTDTVVTDALRHGISAGNTSSAIELHDVEIHSMREENGQLGRGIQVVFGASLEGDNILVRDNVHEGILLSSPGTTAVLTDLTVRDTRPTSAQHDWRGITVADGANLQVTGLQLIANQGTGIQTLNADTEVVLDDCTIRDTRPDKSGEGGLGVVAVGGSSLTLRNCTLTNNTDFGAYAQGTGSLIHMQNSTIEKTRWREAGAGAGESGVGGGASGGATLRLTDTVVRDNHQFGLLGVDPGTRLELTDCEVHNTMPDKQGLLGRGIEVQFGAVLEANGLVMSGNTGLSLAAFDGGAEMLLDNLEVTDTVLLGPDIFSASLHVDTNARAEIRNSHFSGGHLISISGAYENSEILIEDSVIEFSNPGYNGRDGRGVNIEQGTQLTMRRTTVRGNTGVAVIGFDPSSYMVLEDVTIENTEPSFVRSSGVGLVLEQGAVGTATNLEVRGNSGAGVYVSHESYLDMINPTISDNGVAGLVVQAAYVNVSGGRIENNHLGLADGGGVGAYLRSFTAIPSTVVFDGTVFSGNPLAAVYIFKNGAYTFENCSFENSQGVRYANLLDVHGNGIVATRGVEPWDGAQGLQLTNNSFDNLRSYAVLLDESSASLSTNSYPMSSGDLVQQGCEAGPLPIEQNSDLGVVNLCPAQEEIVVPLSYRIELVISGVEF